jgi:hypothetical protein
MKKRKGRKILWLKQKFIGLLLIALPSIFFMPLAQTDWCFGVPIAWFIGFEMLFTKYKIFKRDWYFDIDEFLS